MSCFTTMTAVTAGADLDLTKHVNYTAGMILGVDDFTQEFAYLSGRNRWLARDAIGYGTISGLSVRVEKDGSKGWRVMIAPGAAISPRGQMICVSTAQCAYLDQWLAAAEAEELNDHISGNITSPPITSPPAGDELTLYVVLCYRDCPTDNVPIPGEPCRDENELTAASRIRDDFSLELRFDAPKQAEEDAVRKFVKKLKEIEIIETGTATTLTSFLQALRDEFIPASPPVISAPVTSPPVVLQILKDDVCEYMNAAFRMWVTELRIALSERKTGCSIEMTGGGKFKDCVLLGKIKIPLVVLSPGWKVSDTEAPLVDEKDRPFLLHLRMLQEWLTCGCYSSSDSMMMGLSEMSADNHLLSGLDDVALPSPVTDGQVLMFDNGQWTAKTLTGEGGGVADHGDLSGLGDDDHDKYLLVSGGRALGGDLNGGGKRITHLAAANVNGQAVIFQQAIKQNDDAKGDLGGKYPDPIVVKLQKKDVSSQNPNESDVLVFTSGVWTPKKLEQSHTKPALILPLATVTRRVIVTRGEVEITSFFYEVWFNIAAPKNPAEIKKLTPDNMQILEETKGPTPFLREIKFKSERIFRNVFFIRLTLEDGQAEPNFMRFNFNVNKTFVSVESGNPPLIEYAEKNNIKFTGYMEGDLATVFVHGADFKLG